MSDVGRFLPAGDIVVCSNNNHIKRSQVKHAETLASEVKAAAADAPPATKAEAEAAAQLLAAAAEAMRATVPRGAPGLWHHGVRGSRGR